MEIAVDAGATFFAARFRLHQNVVWKQLVVVLERDIRLVQSVFENKIDDGFPLDELVVQVYLQIEATLDRVFLKEFAFELSSDPYHRFDVPGARTL